MYLNVFRGAPTRFCTYCILIKKQVPVAQLSQRDRAAIKGALVMAKSGILELGEKIFYGHYRSIFNHCDVIGQKAIEFSGKTRNNGSNRSRTFKVIEVGRPINRKPVCDFLLVTNTNWHLILYRFGVIAAYCSNFDTLSF